MATLTFKKGAQGGTRLFFTVPIIDDPIAEHSEDFRVTASIIGGDTGISYTEQSHTEIVRIWDNDCKLKCIARCHKDSFVLITTGVVMYRNGKARMWLSSKSVSLHLPLPAIELESS